MTIESGTYISDLNTNYPEENALVNGGDNHIRWIKSALKTTFPNVAGAITASHTTINDSIASVVAATSANTASTLVKRDASGNISAGMVTGTGFTTTGNMNFGDHDKAVFGAGSDLQIYHNSSASFIDDVGTGSLNIRGNNLYLQKYTGENYLAAIADGAVNLYFNNSQKLATTNTGIDVTGTATMNGLNVDSGTLQVDASNNRVGVNASPSHSLHINSGSADCVSKFESSDGTAYISIKDSSTTHTLHGVGAVGNDLLLYANNAERVRVTSDGKLGIGTSPTEALHISSGGLLIDSHIPNAPSDGTSGFIADYHDKQTRFWSRGDATTRGGYAFKILENDGGGQVDAMVIDASGTLTAKNATFDNGTNTTVDIACDDAGTAELKLMGTDQGTGRLYVGQSATYGGGIEYNGDSNPVTAGGGSDYITLFRRSSSTDHWTARNSYSNNNWEFRGTVIAPTFSGSLSGNASSATNSTKWGGYKISTSQSGSSSDTIYFRT